MRIAVYGLTMGLLAASLQGCAPSTPPPPSAPPPPFAPAGEAKGVTVRLSNFSFDPEILTLKAGVPVTLTLVNDSSGAHDFSAPAFFAASSLQPGSQVTADGRVAVDANQTVAVTLVPRTPGTYPLECTHFLHDTFGMHGTIQVVP